MSNEEAELLSIEIKKAMETTSGYRFSDDEYEVEVAVIMDDIQLLRAFLPLVGKYRMANLKLAKEMLVKHGHSSDYGKHLTYDAMAAYLELAGITYLFTPISENPDRSELYVLSMTASPVDRKRIAFLVKDRKTVDCGVIKELMKDMDNSSISLTSGNL